MPVYNITRLKKSPKLLSLAIVFVLTFVLVFPVSVLAVTMSSTSMTRNVTTVEGNLLYTSMQSSDY